MHIHFHERPRHWHHPEFRWSIAFVPRVGNDSMIAEWMYDHFGPEYYYDNDSKWDASQLEFGELLIRDEETLSMFLLMWK